MAESRQIVSSQTAPHQDLEPVVKKHLASAWERPIAAHTRRAFDEVLPWLKDAETVIVDSCCGTGESTRQLAGHNPDARVLGIDKSAARLGRHGSTDSDNYRLVRADVNDFWRLLAGQGVPVARHCLFYPNPYPKASQLRKRWHGSPAFPSLIDVGGELEVRSNWRVYVEEFLKALGIAGIDARIHEVDTGSPPVSLFEEKYRDSGQALHALTASLSPKLSG